MGVTFWPQSVENYLTVYKIVVYDFLLKLYFKHESKTLKNSGVIICMNFPK